MVNIYNKSIIYFDFGCYLLIWEVRKIIYLLRNNFFMCAIIITCSHGDSVFNKFAV